ncbi:MAG: phosphotransferase family protein [Planctomycetes bacterium]|nr:phosphotransferase family protein [Planctomycetota bacterium]
MTARGLTPPSGEEGSLRDAVRRFLAERLGAPVDLARFERLPGGACQELYRVEFSAAGGPLQRLALRADARRSIRGSLNRAQEHEVITAAVRAGVKTPAARWLAKGLAREGAWSYFLDWGEGEALGRRVVAGPELAPARARLPSELAAVLARVHAVPVGDLPGLAALPGSASAGRSAASAWLEVAGAWLRGLPDFHPALDLALDWLSRHPPRPAPVALCHGDFRVGNFLVTPAGLSAVLDWEFAHLGDPADDIAWLCLRDWRFGNLSLPAGGLTTREAFFAEYERAGGGRVDPAAVRWWEVMGNVRWALGALDQAERYLSGAERDLELLATGRRAAEMEWEALRLIETA